MNDSSTGGFLAPSAAEPAPLTGQGLNRFLQQWLVGITGLEGSLVRPQYQKEPTNIPDAGEAWCSFRVLARRGDTFPFIGHSGEGDGYDQLIRNEELDLIASFYDLGTNGLADYYAELMRDGAIIAQNRAYLQAQNFDVGSVGDLISVPVLLKSRWQYRVDLSVQVRRQVSRQYPVLNIESIDGTLVSDTGIEVPVEAP